MATGKKILGVTGGIVGLLLIGKVGLGFLNQPDDKTLITEAIKEAQKASKEGRPGGVMDFLSVSHNSQCRDQFEEGRSPRVVHYSKKILENHTNPRPYGRSHVPLYGQLK